ncbi:DUF1931 domain-containing protein [archaeon]|jgi:histone H3/H4|nr:DUF1931 domain-containing protein [archaeon]MBT6698738.1 DUF1931 domain-containing protein [archaeon]
MIVVRTQIKDLLRESGTGVENMSNDFMDKLDSKVRALITDACNRAKENGRKTVMPRDV